MYLQKVMSKNTEAKKLIFCWHLETLKVTEEKSRIRIRNPDGMDGMDPRIQIRIKT
jgi:hypothetical protein